MFMDFEDRRQNTESLVFYLFNFFYFQLSISQFNTIINTIGSSKLHYNNFTKFYEHQMLVMSKLRIYNYL